MKNLFKVGCNFDPNLINIVANLNEKYKETAQVMEFFGSTKKYGELTARPDWRLQDLSDKEFETYVKESLKNNIKFNYTINSILPYGSKQEIIKNKQKLQDFVKYLEDIGVYRITIANPIIAMIIREVSNIELEISCISHIDTVTQLKYFHETLGINKFCGSILKNRNKTFLTNVAKYCNEHNLIYELLANEFCGVAKDNYATHCVYRDSCYLCHATCKTKEDSELYNNYPMKYCMFARNNNNESWIKMRVIRPEDLHYYNDIGLNYFKVSGRTGTSEYISMVLEAYMKQSFDGNFLSLWKPLETIYNGKSELTHTFSNYIDNKKLNGFLDHWFNENFNCEDQICGETCNYCKEFYTKNLV